MSEGQVNGWGWNSWCPGCQAGITYSHSYPGNVVIWTNPPLPSFVEAENAQLRSENEYLRKLVLDLLAMRPAVYLVDRDMKQTRLDEKAVQDGCMPDTPL